ncbi:hypothetical protein TTSV1_gp11 [Thermoproteus tenax spherical virus 1]|uniref:Uncharacterized protein n=1 Tax=Thermoproteus tenax spherical virus 1 TaxID=292639 RepID=Q647F1_9VIRU|nr:hypothetical protein TTSV1_gp11 [Thermoproteus tenax spherical virus 1]AAU25961.1 hypothetical protein [Thermoproteus tenax spherical virus 1]
MDLRTIYTASVLAAAIVTALVGFVVTESLLAPILIFLTVLAIFDYWGYEAAKVVAPMTMFLYTLAFFGALSGVQLIIIAAVIISALALKEKPKLAGPWHATLAYPLRLAALAPLVLLLGPLYLIYDAVRRGGIIYKAAAVLGAIGMGLFMFGRPLSLWVDPHVMSFGWLAQILPPEANPIYWVGAIGWEELISRAIGPLGNAWWAIMHLPSRLAALPVLPAIGIVLLINIGGRWLWETYKEGGLIGSIIGHAVYNAMVSAFALGIQWWPTLIIISIILYATFRKP